MKYVKSEDVRNLILDNVRGTQMFSMVFDRVAAKCPVCGKSNKKWNNLEKCPICGEELSKERFTRAQLHVQNPKHTLVPGTGMYIGESNEEALEDNRLKYFDMDAIGRDGGKGDYRQTRIENIKKIKLNGEEYLVLK